MKCSVRFSHIYSSKNSWIAPVVIISSFSTMWIFSWLSLVILFIVNYVILNYHSSSHGEGLKRTVRDREVGCASWCYIGVTYAKSPLLGLWVTPDYSECSWTPAVVVGNKSGYKALWGWGKYISLCFSKDSAFGSDVWRMVEPEACFILWW